MEGRRAHAVAHLAYARSQKSGTGILGSKRVLQGGEKSSPLSVLRDLWLVYGVYGLDGGKCGLGSKIMVLGQTLVAGNVVRGAKPRVWVKPWWREMWSRERNRGFGSNAGGGKCGPGRETAGLGQALVAGNVVQGEKPRPRVKPGLARAWSRERNRGFGSSPAPPQCGPWSKTAGLGQTQPRPSVVQGEKPRPRVKPGPAEAWSSHLKYKKESKQTYERWIYQSRSDCPGQ